MSLSSSSPWLVLFDIDGTLVQTGRAGVRGMNAAFTRLFGADNALEGTLIAGRTDRGIITEVLRRLGRDATDDEVAQVRDEYVARLRHEIVQPAPSPKRVLPGVEPLLDALTPRPGTALGLLTGNFQAGARIKLDYFDLWQRFAFGAFGDDHCDRRPLVPLAVERARVDVPRHRVVVIGDTPLDVDCARAYGARAIGVATGPYDTATLRVAGADLAVETLEDAAVLHFLQEE